MGECPVVGGTLVTGGEPLRSGNVNKAYDMIISTPNEGVRFTMRDIHLGCGMVIQCSL